jgi:hypothetical protein
VHWLTDYAWEDDDGTLHIDVERALISKGIPLTQENIDGAAELLAAEARKQMPGSIIEVDE